MIGKEDYETRQIVEAAEQIATSSENTAVEIDLDPETLEILETMYFERLLTDEIDLDGEALPDPADMLDEGANATMFKKFDTLFDTAYLGSTATLSVRETEVINRDLIDTITRLREAGDTDRENTFQRLYIRLNAALTEASQSNVVFRREYLLRVSRLENAQN